MSDDVDVRKTGGGAWRRDRAGGYKLSGIEAVLVMVMLSAQSIVSAFPNNASTVCQQRAHNAENSIDLFVKRRRMEGLLALSVIAESAFTAEI